MVNGNRFLRKFSGMMRYKKICLQLNKPVHGEEQPEQRIRKSRYRHARVRYHSPPTSESDSNSRSSSSQRDDPGPFVLESSVQRRKRRLAHARRFGIDPPSQTVDVSTVLISLLSCISSSMSIYIVVIECSF